MAVSPGGRPADASPLGKKPGGPRGLSDYTRMIAHALMRRGMSKSHAIAVARASEAKRFSHSKNPAIAAAAVAAVAEDHVLDHRKKGRRDMSNVSTTSVVTVPKFDAIDRPRQSGRSPYATIVLGDIDLDWAEWNANHQGPGQPGAQPDLLSAQTHTNIAAFQKAHGLPVTGQIDAKTVAWLNNPANGAAAAKAAKGAASKSASAAKKLAAAKVAAAKKADAAAKKAAAAHDKEVKNANTARANADKTAAKAKSDADKLSATRGRVAVAAGRASTKSLSVPMVASQDGARMTNVRALNIEKLKRAQKKRGKK